MDSFRQIYHVLQPHFEGSARSPFTLPKMGLGSPLGLPKTHSKIAGVKTPCIEVLFIPLEFFWSVDVQNGLQWAIWISAAQVMVERRAGSQTGNLTPDHKKSGIDPILVRLGEVQHTIGKLSRRITTCFRPHPNPSSPIGIVSRLHFGSPGKKCHLDASAMTRCRKYYMGEGGGFPWVRAVVSQVSPRLLVACFDTKSVQNEF
jgi:hypothetical protein